MSSSNNLLDNLARDHALNPRAARPLMNYYRNDILARLAQGNSLKQAWAALKAERKINFRYETFRRLSRQLSIAPTPSVPAVGAWLH
jgi:Family of unknown function (DUF5338)